MPLLKRKPVLMHPLPPLAAIVQPVNPPSAKDPLSATGESTPNTSAALPANAPEDGQDEEEQYDKLVSALNDPTLSAPVAKRGQRPSVNGAANGGMLPPVAPASAAPGYRVKNIDVFYIPETGEIFLDYESYAARRAFYEQPLFQCEVSGKSSLTYVRALQNEAKEVQQLHARFPRQLKKAVLESVQFQVEGKLETLADKVYERFVNRFYDDEKVFVDVQGDKYLARVVKTFPPKKLMAPEGNPYHPYATDLGLSNEEVAESDDPMKYFYNVRLIEEGGEAEREGSSTDSRDERKGEMWQSSVMEVQADKISRDRINFSRAMLKRFIRDCVSRDAAIYSPWLVKKSVAQHYGLPTEMTDEIRAAIQLNRERQMDKRKRDREERLGIAHSDDEVKEEAPPAKKKKMSKAEREKEEKEKKEREEEEKKKKRGIKYPIEDMLLEYAPERDEPAGRIEVRPAPNKDLPFGEEFEKFFMAWSFLNVMGEGLGLSSFTIDEFEQALYHKDNYTGPVPLLVEIHATLLNALVRDLKAGHDPVRPLAHCGQVADNDTDYWEGTKGATTETLRPVAETAAETWSKKELSPNSDRKGWEMALVGCLWERATLDTLPQYLDNILYLTFEDKPAPTRPTWSTGPSSGTTASGLILAKPEKRYTSLHFLHKLNIINFLIELVAQTSVIRDFMEESTQALTEVRKEQIEAKREWRRVRAEREALEPKKENPAEEGDEVKEEPGSPNPQSPNGHLNGDKMEHDELDDSIMGDEETPSRATSPLSDSGRVKTAGSRRRALLAQAAEREAEEKERAKEREELRAKRAETKHVAAEKKRLEEEEAALEKRLHELEQDFRRFLYTLRGRPLGTDRFGNKVWWLDGLGSAPLYVDDKLQWGTGRLYLQGVEDMELEMLRLPADIPLALINERREKEEGGRLAPGEWGAYDTPEQLLEFYNWLNPRGIRELHLQRVIKTWWTEIDGGIRRRRIAVGLDSVPEVEEPTRRVRPTRRAAGGEEVLEGYLGWRNRRA